MPQFTLPSFTPLAPDRVRFFAVRRERILALYPTYADLRNRLLQIGGLEVVLPRYDEYSETERSRQRYETPRILEQGQSWPGSLARLQQMEDSNCHMNTAILSKDGAGSIASGFALSEDGLWREHSWIVQSPNRLLESTVLRLVYHGYLLSLEEQRWFVSAELGPDDAGAA